MAAGPEIAVMCVRIRAQPAHQSEVVCLAVSRGRRTQTDTPLGTYPCAHSRRTLAWEGPDPPGSDALMLGHSIIIQRIMDAPSKPGLSRAGTSRSSAAAESISAEDTAPTFPCHRNDPSLPAAVERGCEHCDGLGCCSGHRTPEEPSQTRPLPGGCFVRLQGQMGI